MKRQLITDCDEQYKANQEGIVATEGNQVRKSSLVGRTG